MLLNTRSLDFRTRLCTLRDTAELAVRVLQAVFQLLDEHLYPVVLYLFELLDELLHALLAHHRHVAVVAAQHGERAQHRLEHHLRAVGLLDDGGEGLDPHLLADEVLDLVRVGGEHHQAARALLPDVLALRVLQLLGERLDAVLLDHERLGCAGWQPGCMGRQLDARGCRPDARGCRPDARGCRRATGARREAAAFALSCAEMFHTAEAAAATTAGERCAPRISVLCSSCTSGRTAPSLTMRSRRSGEVRQFLRSTQKARMHGCRVRSCATGGGEHRVACQPGGTGLPPLARMATGRWWR
eukprot:scaffold39735_cov61-Phaeocystis_antarctica.AAC.2